MTISYAEAWKIVRPRGEDIPKSAHRIARQNAAVAIAVLRGEMPIADVHLGVAAMVRRIREAQAKQPTAKKTIRRTKRVEESDETIVEDDDDEKDDENDDKVDDDADDEVEASGFGQGGFAKREPNPFVDGLAPILVGTDHEHRMCELAKRNPIAAQAAAALNATSSIKDR